MRNQSTSTRRWLPFFLLAGSLQWACGDGGELDAPGGGGAAGQTGKAGQAGAAGKAGAGGGTAGKGGSAGAGGGGGSSGGKAGSAGTTGGQAGESGSAGVGGDAGAAGDAGSGGSDAGAGGESGTSGQGGDGGAGGDAGAGGSDAGAGGDAGAAGDGGAGGSGVVLSEACQGCIATNCDTQFNACASDPACLACATGDPTTPECLGNPNLLAAVACACQPSTCAATDCAAECAIFGGGQGGSGGQGGDGGSGGSGGGQCSDPSECPGTDDTCQFRTCEGGQCGIAFAAQGVLLPGQNAGDCKVDVCDGSGAVVTQNDDTDVPASANSCVSLGCNGGTVVSTNVAAGAACGDSLKCDGDGNCVGCLDASDCPGVDSECQVRACSSGVCSVVNTPDGTLLSVQIDGNCLEAQCNGVGGIKQVPANDPSDDGKECTVDTCNAGVPQSSPKNAGTACSEGGGSVCDGGSNCVECLDASSCPQPSGPCQIAACVAGACSFTNVAAGTVLASQTVGDCKENQCDGNGVAVIVNKNSDIPVDNNPCTQDVCTAGVPSNPPVSSGTNCGGTNVCNAQGQCVGCNGPSDCPGTDTECQARTCNAGVCGFSFTAAGTPVASQTAGDCKRNECNGSGAIAAATFNSDVPVDGNACTQDVCTAGVPSNPPQSSGTACNQNGGKVCDGASSCVQCVAPSDCPGADTECQARTCNAGVCGFSFTAAGTPVAAQTAGDCKRNECNGSGAVVAATFNSDVPVDGNVCTQDVCTAGVPSNPPVSPGTKCGGTNVCNAQGQCVGCNGPSDCPGTDTECQARTCNAGVCGFSFTAAGTPVASQTAGDCKENQCDGSGAIVSTNKDSDIPKDDGNTCTGEACSSGTPVHPPQPSGTVCNQNGGKVCDGASSCVECVNNAQCPSGVCTGNKCQSPSCSDNVKNGSESDVDCGGSCPDCADGKACNVNGDCQSNNCSQNVCAAAPAVVSTTPADNSSVPAPSTIAVTFNQAMNPATLTAQTAPGACTGTIQVSLDNFATCIAMSAASAVVSNGNATATVTPAPGLLVNRKYKIRVTTGAASAGGATLPATFTQPNGFTTTSPNLCDGTLVISQVYGGGGSSGVPFKNDFVELHNRGNTTIDVSAFSIQYASSAGTSWSRTNLVGSIPAGGYYLIQLGGGNSGADLPTPDATGSTAMSGTAGKVALVSNQTTLTGACPLGAPVVDFVGYGGAANCSEGGTPTSAPTSSTAVFRLQEDCADVDLNSADFFVAAPAPRNSATAAAVCKCVVQNESDAGLEADYCAVQFPLSLSVQTATLTPLVYGRIFEAGITEAAGANSLVRAQLGYGPTSLNPQYEAWTWSNATFNTQSGNDDEYQGSFTAPAPGKYSYAYRFSLDNGVSWTVCDANSGDFGAGSNAGLTFELGSLPSLSVTP